jgi:hypothetical protein
MGWVGPAEPLQFKTIYCPGRWLPSDGDRQESRPLTFLLLGLA